MAGTFALKGEVERVGGVAHVRAVKVKVIESGDGGQALLSKHFS